MSRIKTLSRLIEQGDLKPEAPSKELIDENTPVLEEKERKSRPQSEGILVDSTNIRNASSQESLRRQPKNNSTPTSRYEIFSEAGKRLTKLQFLSKCPRCTGPVASPLPSPSISSQESLNDIPSDADNEKKCMGTKGEILPKGENNLLCFKMEGLNIISNPKKRYERRKKKKESILPLPNLSLESDKKYFHTPSPSYKFRGPEQTPQTDPSNTTMLTPPPSSAENSQEISESEAKDTNKENSSALFTPDSGINNHSYLDSSSILMSILESPESSQIRSPLSPRTPPDQLILNKSQKDSSLRRRVLCHNALCKSYRGDGENDSPLNESLHFCNPRSSNSEKSQKKERENLKIENENNSSYLIEPSEEQIVESQSFSVKESETKSEETSVSRSQNESEESSCLSVLRGDLTRSLIHYLHSPRDVKSSPSEWNTPGPIIQEAFEIPYEEDEKKGKDEEDKSLLVNKTDSLDTSSFATTPITDEEFVVECPKCHFRFCSKCQNSSEDSTKPHHCRFIDSWLSSTDDSLLSFKSNASSCTSSATSSTKSKKKGKNKYLQRLK